MLNEGANEGSPELGTLVSDLRRSLLQSSWIMILSCEEEECQDLAFHTGILVWTPAENNVINLPLSLPESIMETSSVVLTFESVFEILWCDHLHETSSSSAVLLNGTIRFSIFYKMKFGICL